MSPEVSTGDPRRRQASARLEAGGRRGLVRARRGLRARTPMLPRQRGSARIRRRGSARVRRRVLAEPVPLQPEIGGSTVVMESPSEELAARLIFAACIAYGCDRHAPPPPPSTQPSSTAASASESPPWVPPKWPPEAVSANVDGAVKLCAGPLPVADLLDTGGLREQSYCVPRSSKRPCDWPNDPRVVEGWKADYPAAGRRFSCVSSDVRVETNQCCYTVRCGYGKGRPMTVSGAVAKSGLVQRNDWSAVRNLDGSRPCRPSRTTASPNESDDGGDRVLRERDGAKGRGGGSARQERLVTRTLQNGSPSSSR
jgi:hypothetical protein